MCILKNIQRKQHHIFFSLCKSVRGLTLSKETFNNFFGLKKMHDSMSGNIMQAKMQQNSSNMQLQLLYNQCTIASVQLFINYCFDEKQLKISSSASVYMQKTINHYSKRFFVVLLFAFSSTITDMLNFRKLNLMDITFIL